MRLELTPRSTFGAATIIGLAMAVVLALPGTAALVSQSAPAEPQSYYLALGDSIAYGFKPNKPGAGPSALAGYVDPFAVRLRKLSPNIQVVNYGCPGESTVTFSKGGCPWLAEGRKLHDAFRGSQLDAALSFLRGSPRAGQSDHPDALGQRPGSAVARKARAHRKRSRRSRPASARSFGGFGQPRRALRSS